MIELKKIITKLKIIELKESKKKIEKLGNTEIIYYGKKEIVTNKKETPKFDAHKEFMSKFSYLMGIANSDDESDKGIVLEKLSELEKELNIKYSKYLTEEEYLKFLNMISSLNERLNLNIGRGGR